MQKIMQPIIYGIAMSSFVRIASTIAAITFVITMIIVAFVIKRNRYGAIFPPVVGECPDYWSASQKGSHTVCHNALGLGDTTNCPNVARKGSTMVFSGPQWAGQKGVCNKARWANKCGMAWDGISGDNSCS